MRGKVLLPVLVHVLKSSLSTYRGILISVHANPAGQTEHQRTEKCHKMSSNVITPHGMLMKVSMGMVPPPQTQTVKKTMSRVVENIICRA